VVAAGVVGIGGEVALDELVGLVRLSGGKRLLGVDEVRVSPRRCGILRQ